KLGAVKYGNSSDEPFLGRTMGHERDYSDAVAAEIDAEVRALIELAHDEAWAILTEYRDVLDNIVLELMEKETISYADMERLCARVVKRPPMAPYNGFGKRRPSNRPPVLTPAERKALEAQKAEKGEAADAAEASGNGQAGTPQAGNAQAGTAEATANAEATDKAQATDHAPAADPAKPADQAKAAGGAEATVGGPNPHSDGSN